MKIRRRVFERRAAGRQAHVRGDFQHAVIVGGGVVVRRLSVEVRLTRGLQPIFKDRAGILDALVQVGGYRPNLEQYYLPQVAPILERAKSRDLSFLLGVRF